MSQALTCLPQRALCIMAGGLTLLSAAHTFAGDSPTLAGQKLQQEITGAIAEAQQLQGKEPAKALFLLKACQQKLQQDNNLTNVQRAELLAAVAKQIKALPASAGSGKKDQDDLRAQYEKGKQGKPGTGGPGTGAAGTAGNLIGGLKEKYDELKNGKDKVEKGQLALIKPPDLGDIPPGDAGVKFPKNWQQLLEMRKKNGSLTEGEAKVLKAMNSQLTVDYAKQPFQEVIKDLQERSGLSIAIDPNAMKALEIEYNTPVSFQPKGKVSLRTALKKILGEVGLAYILKEGVVQVVTPQAAMNTMTTQSYYVGDLIPPAPPGAGPFFNAAREQWFANQIMQMIVTTVEPQSWQANGNGPGTISYNPISKTIVVRNSAEMHLSLKSALSGGN